MAINAEWDNPEKTILCYYFEQRWTWDEFFAARNEALSMIDTVAHKVGVIMNTPSNIVLPSNVLTHSLSSLRHKHPNTVIIVFIAGKPFLNMIISTMNKILHSGNMAMADDMDEARTLIVNRLRAVGETPVCPLE